MAMGSEAASEAEMLDAIAAIAGAAITVLSNTRPVAGVPDSSLDRLEEACNLARALLAPKQWGAPVFVTLVELVNAALAVSQHRRHGLDDADAALAVALGHAQDLFARNRTMLA
jgi:hypothetical protein